MVLQPHVDKWTTTFLWTVFFFSVGDCMLLELNIVLMTMCRWEWTHLQWLSMHGPITVYAASQSRLEGALELTTSCGSCVCCWRPWGLYDTSVRMMYVVAPPEGPFSTISSTSRPLTSSVELLKLSLNFLTHTLTHARTHHRKQTNDSLSVGPSLGVKHLKQ